VRQGEVLAAPGPFLGTHGAIAGTAVCEADDLEAAIAPAARIPATRLGGAIDIRPVATNW
jgi:hypothetical protein